MLIRNHKARRLAWLFLTLGWMIFILLLSHQPGKASEHLSASVAQTIGASEAQYRLRTNMHFLLYFVLGLLLWKDSREFKVRILWPAVFGCGFAWIDEYTKNMIPGRHYELADAMRNMVGLGIGLLFGYVIWSLAEIVRERQH